MSKCARERERERDWARSSKWVLERGEERRGEEMMKNPNPIYDNASIPTYNFCELYCIICFNMRGIRWPVFWYLCNGTDVVNRTSSNICLKCKYWNQGPSEYFGVILHRFVHK